MSHQSKNWVGMILGMTFVAAVLAIVFVGVGDAVDRTVGQSVRDFYSVRSVEILGRTYKATHILFRENGRCIAFKNVETGRPIEYCGHFLLDEASESSLRPKGQASS